MHTVLIVEDDPALRRGLEDNFTREGYVVKSEGDGDRGLEIALNQDIDLLLLDIMLPGLNGYEVCRELRRAGKTVPTIMLTAKSEESDLLLGLGLGADDYITKPFSIRELLARVEAVLRRTSPDEEEVGSLQFGEFTLDPIARELRRNGLEVELSPKEYALLEYFAQRPGRALGRDQIMSGVWGYDALVTQRSIDRFVTSLRRKIEDNPRRPKHILTVREFGYKFVSGG